MRTLKALPLLPLTAGLLVAATVAGPAGANHSWNNYHWARTINPFELKLGDNVSSAWASYLVTTSTDWSASDVLDTTKVTGGANPKNCRPTAGRVEVCSSSYGNNGWLGLAQIWISGSHITQGAVKVNDYYFNTAKYNAPAWRNLVMCQEVGHTLGLGHNDEDFENTPTGTCMDYSNDPQPNQHPNAHDYAQLKTIYAHLDSTTTVGTLATSARQDGAGAGNSQAEWGQAIRYDGDGRPSLFVRELGNDQRVFTFVTWTR